MSRLPKSYLFLDSPDKRQDPIKREHGAQYLYCPLAVSADDCHRYKTPAVSKGLARDATEPMRGMARVDQDSAKL